jgi:hypothetical protein
MSRPVVRAISIDERGARLAVRHRLAPSARTDEDTAAIARSVVALHATDPLTVVLSAIVRMKTPDLLTVERALFVDRSVLRMLAMRRTLFTVAVEDAPMIQAGASDAVAVTERTRLVKMLEDAEVTTDGRAWLADVERKALAAMDHLGEATATDLAKAVPQLGTRITLAAGKSYEATVSLASRILVVLGAEGHLVRGHPKGRWTGSQHRWTTAATWLGQVPAPMAVDDARTALARRWLQQFGPGTVGDLKWWTGWTLGATRAALANLETEDVDLDGVAALVLAGDVGPPPDPEPWVALLPSLDPTIMGWFERDWYVGDHRQQVFDRYGNAGPTIWADGRVVGAWSQRKDGEVVTRLLEDIGAERAAMVDAEAGRLPELLGEIVIAPRFNSPLSRELAR